MRFTEQDRVCIPVPLYHCFGMVIGNLGCLTHGAAMVYPSEGFDPLATLEAIEAERCTRRLRRADDVHRRDGPPRFREIRSVLAAHRHHGRQPLPDRGHEARRRADAPLRDRHRLRHDRDEPGELCSRSTDDPIERRVSTVGRVMPHVEAKIVDAEGRIVPRGTAGELLTRGYLVMLGYWNDEEKTREAIDAAGWMHTGDLATIDDEGYCNIVGRIKDMVIRGGENVYPREIEEFLYRHPKIQDVQVIGVPDPRYGEELCAWVRLRDGESATAEEIRAFCQGQIAHYKVPRYVKFVDGFPMTVTGKIQKFLMRQQMIEELGLSRAGDRLMSRIASVATHMISVPRPQPVWTAHEESKAWNVILTEMRTDDGLVGYGEIHGAPMPRICEWVSRFGEIIRGHGCAGACRGVGEALRADLAAPRRHRGPRRPAAARPARRARPGHGGDRRHRHRLVGHQRESRRPAGLSAAGRREPADLHLCDGRLLPAGCDQCRLRRRAGALPRSRLPRGQAQDRSRHRRRRRRSGSARCAGRSATSRC